MREDIIIQGVVISEIDPEHDRSKDIVLVERYAPIFRKIINEVVEDKHRLPTKDEIIWIASEKTHHNIREDYLYI